MADELAIYKNAASEGKLVKTSTKGTSSNARKIWERENKRSVPDG
jgi:hypothetical protein